MTEVTTKPASRTRLDQILAAVAAPTFPLYTVLVGVYVLFRVGSFTNIPDRVTDTSTYEDVARFALWDWRFYAGKRGFTVPLFFKLFQSSEARIVAQLMLSIVAWLVLAAALSRSVRNGWLRPFAFALVLAFSLTTEVILWDTLLFSESIAFALCALLLAAWIIVVREPRPGSAVAVLVLSALWVFARDTNAYVVLLTGALAAITLLRPEHRRLKLALALGCCAIFALDYGSAEAGNRWLQPMRDIVTHRVIPNRSLKEYFVAHGLDVNGNYPESAWMRHDARRVYAGYLLTHPGYTLAQPFHGRQEALYSTPANATSLLDPSMKIYNDNASHRFLPLPHVLERILFPRGIAVVLAFVAAVLAAAALVARLVGMDTVWLVPLGVLLTTYPHFLVVWHESGVEVDRHALQASVLLRLAALMLALLALDRVLTVRRPRWATRTRPSAVAAPRRGAS